MSVTFDYNEVVSRATLKHEDGSVAEVFCVKPGKPFMDWHGAKAAATRAHNADPFGFKAAGYTD